MISVPSFGFNTYGKNTKPHSRVLGSAAGPCSAISSCSRASSFSCRRTTKISSPWWRSTEMGCWCAGPAPALPPAGTWYAGGPSAPGSLLGGLGPSSPLLLGSLPPDSGGSGGCSTIWERAQRQNKSSGVLDAHGTQTPLRSSS